MFFDKLFKRKEETLQQEISEIDETSEDTDFCNNIKDLVKLAKKADVNYQIFGAQTHKYQFHPPVGIEEISKFEKTYNIELPKAYVVFLTCVGNGGAGPYYGLYSLKEVEKNNEYLEQGDLEDTFIDNRLTVEKWNEIVDMMENAEDDEYDYLMKKVTKGALVIGTQGCSIDTLLMCSGTEKGKIAYIDWNMDYNYPPILTNLTFEEWMTTYFQKVIADDTCTYPNLKKVKI